MTTPRTRSRTRSLAQVSVVAALMVTGCSDPSAPSASASPTSPAAKAPAPTAPAAPTPSRASSAFCADLPTFQLAMLSYQADVGKVLQNQPLDFAEPRRKAALIAGYGKRMRGSAPPDIARHFTTVLDAVAASARAVKPGGSGRAVVEPVYGKRNRAAFDAVQKYECR
ncbi:hypothetical protein ACFQU9_02030 [Actinomadura namibiensis]|uniref:Lipoprotein n=1 Tax=Actinomadura namibiensis TaxID=182080 RepID=A0A7W3LMY2_ACTNM|nr:hypothetical protein [Actinomadura namibiensis]MBA8951017.1 hypothetical protein [Actinomadura namibiensis]